MSREGSLRVSFRIGDPYFGPQYEAHVTIEREQVEGIIQRAAGSGSVEWEAINHFLAMHMQQALLGWAHSAAPDRVRRVVERREIGAMTVENLTRHVRAKLQEDE